MIPADIRLFTWLDAEDVVARAREKGSLPNWFVGAQAYWDGLTITVQTGHLAEVRSWLNGLFEPRVTEQAGDFSIALESVQDSKRLLPIQIEETDSQPPRGPMILSFNRPSAISSGPQVPPPPITEDGAPIVAFHSFKGGVGRTTHAVATALRIAEGRRVMLVDADFEAPGISWLLRTRLPAPPISFADMLAIMHGDPSPNGEEVLSLSCDRLLGSSFDNCVFVPAFRSSNSLHSLDIRPEHIALSKRDPFFIRTFLSALAKRLGVEVVLVDLRAGFSELSASLLLDPRVYRVFVTNLSGQSLYGTQLLMEFVAQRAPSASEFDPYPAIAVTQVPENYEAERLRDGLVPLQEAWQKFVVPKDLLSQADQTVILRTGFDRTLQALPADWTALTEALRKSEAFAQASILLDWLPFTTQPILQLPASNQIRDSRKKLSEDAGRRIFAEKSEDDDFLDTPALRALVQDNLRSVPISVVVGAKGAGKTLTFIRLAKLGTWEAFTQKVLGGSGGGETFINPVLLPISLDQNVLLQIGERAKRLVDSVGQFGAIPYTELRDYLIKCKQQLSTDTEWRDAWLNAIAWSSGLTTLPNDGKGAIGRFNPGGKRLVAIFDGLEDLFQEVATDSKQQIALRALVQEVPLWLSQIPNRALGIVVFIRRDLVEFAVRQNVAQLLDRYKPYALNWNRAEALRLTYWLASKAGVMEKPPEHFARLTEEEVAELLIPLWGRKLGSDRSRDARTAVWVLDALSDYNGQVQARDLVRFVHFAAEKSGPDPKWPDRILTPAAIRDSLPACSREKVRETRDENLVLREIFNKIDKIPAADRKAPFGAGFGGLTAEDLTTLQQNGAILLDRDLYWVAEIYLHGLGFSYSAPGRRRVMSTRR